MIVGGYSLHLYCDFCIRSGWQGVEFDDRDHRTCMKEARKQGWTFTRTKPKKCRCPRCSGNYPPPRRN